MKNQIRIKMAGYCFQIELNYQETANLFLPDFIDGGHNNQIKNTINIPSVSLSYMKEVKDALNKLNGIRGFSNSFVEYKALSMIIYTVFLHLNYLTVHGLAFRLNSSNQSVVLAAPSRTGKTTQYLNWKQLDTDEISIINGDVSLIDMNTDDLTIWTSPWCGKENFSGNHTGPLKVMVILQQGKENRIFRLDQQESIKALYPQALYLTLSEKEIDQICNALTKLINQIPIFKFINDGSLESTEILREFIKNELE